MEEAVLKSALDHYQNILKNAILSPQQKLYQLSMPLLAFAAIKKLDGYQDTFCKMEQLLCRFSSQIEAPWALWMLGRMALASKLIKDFKNLEKIKEELSSTLFQNNLTNIMIISQT